MMPPWKYMDWQIRDKLYQLRGWPRWLSWLRTMFSRSPRPGDELTQRQAEERRVAKRADLMGALIDEATRIDRENDPNYTPERVSGEAPRVGWGKQETARYKLDLILQGKRPPRE